MSQDQQKWHEQYVQWKAFTLVISIAVVIFGAIYTIANAAMEIAQENRNQVGIIEERQNNQYNEIKGSLERIENALTK